MAKETIEAILAAEKQSDAAEASAKTAASQQLWEAKEKAEVIISEKTEAAKREAEKIISAAKRDAEKIMNDAKESESGIKEIMDAFGKFKGAAEKAVIEKIV